MRLTALAAFLAIFSTTQSQAQTLAAHSYNDTLNIGFVHTSCEGTPEVDECVVMDFGCENGPLSFSFFELDDKSIAKSFENSSYPKAELTIEGKSEELNNWRIRYDGGYYAHVTDFLLIENKNIITNSIKNKDKIYISVNNDTFIIDPRMIDYSKLSSMVNKCYEKFKDYR
ncbi:hypothetical protein ABDF71_02955 [Ochrobactrum sp. WV_118_8]